MLSTMSLESVAAPSLATDRGRKFGSPVLEECHSRAFRSIVETNRIAACAALRHPFLTEEQLCSAVRRAAVTAHEYALFARFHHQRERLLNEGGGISVFGSARPKENDSNPIKARAYQLALRAGQVIVNSKLPIKQDGTLGEAGLAVISGAGPGLMDASCRGANPTKSQDGKVWGHAIYLPHESPNPYIPRDRFAVYQRFPIRKLALIDDMSRGVLACPGGYGTNEEFLETLSLVESNTLPKKPIVFLDTQFWNPIVDIIRSTGITKPQTLNNLVVLDTPEQGMRYIKDWYEQNPAQKDFNPFRMLNDFNRKECMYFSPSDLEQLSQQSGKCGIGLQKKIDNVSEFIDETFKNHFASLRITQDCDEAVIFGTLKLFADRFMLECGLAMAGVDEVVLQLGTTTHPDFIANREELHRRGKTVAARMSPELLAKYGCESGLQVQKPGQAPIFLPCRYRLTAIDVVTEHMTAVVASEGKLSSLHRLSEIICWKQTGKLLPKIGVVAVSKDDSGIYPTFFNRINQPFLDAGFIGRDDRSIVRIDRDAKSAIDSLGF